MFPAKLMFVAMVSVFVLAAAGCGGGGGGDAPGSTIPFGTDDSTASIADRALVDPVPLPDYVDNGDGTVTDNVSGLMWQQRDDKITYNWYEASGTANATYNPGSVTDVCASLGIGGYRDWRLPSKKELIFIVDYSSFNPAIDSTFFPTTIASSYWSSTTTEEERATYAWYVEFLYGFASLAGITDDVKYYARCVRGGICPPGQVYLPSGLLGVGCY